MVHSDCGTDESSMTSCSTGIIPADSRESETNYSLPVPDYRYCTLYNASTVTTTECTPVAMPSDVNEYIPTGFDIRHVASCENCGYTYHLSVRQRICSRSTKSEHFVTKYEVTSDDKQLPGCGSTRRSKRRRRKMNKDCATSTCRKWRPLPLSQTGFSTSLLPRRPEAFISERNQGQQEVVVVVAAGVGPVDFNSPDPNTSSSSSPSSFRISEVSHECADVATLIQSNEAPVISDDADKLWLESLLQSDNDSTEFDDDMDIGCRWQQYGITMEELRIDRPLRSKKKWRVEKARRQVKTSHCRRVSNCVHGVTLYVNHRIIKSMSMVIQPTSHRPCSVTLRQIDREKSVTRTSYKRQHSHAPFVWDTERSSEVSEAQLLYAVDRCSADSSLPPEVLSLLVALQHRELDPNDYELLLRLDDRVQPRTVSESQLAALRVDELLEADLANSPINCGVCLEPFELGHRRKYLHCGHSFHDVCIDAWLRQSSTKCPLDGLEAFL